MNEQAEMETHEAGSADPNRRAKVRRVQAKAMRLLAELDRANDEAEAQDDLAREDWNAANAECEKLRSGVPHADCTPDIQAQVDARYAITNAKRAVTNERRECVGRIRDKIMNLLATVHPHLAVHFYPFSPRAVREMVRVLHLLDTRDELIRATTSTPADPAALEAGDFLYVDTADTCLTRSCLYRVTCTTAKTLWLVNPLAEADDEFPVRRRRLGGTRKVDDVTVAATAAAMPGVWYVAPDTGTKAVAFAGEWAAAIAQDPEGSRA